MKSKCRYCFHEDKGAPSKTTQGNESKNTPEVGGVASGGVGVGRSQ